MILNETYTLSNGIRIPKLGLGTWFIPAVRRRRPFGRPSPWATGTSIPHRRIMIPAPY